MALNHFRAKHFGAKHFITLGRLIVLLGAAADWLLRARRRLRR